MKRRKSDEDEVEEDSDDDDDEEGEEESDEDDDNDDDDDDDGEEEEEDLQVDTDGRVVVGGEMDYATRCFDDALRLDAEQTASLFKQCEAAFTARETGSEEYSAGATFWVGADAKPQTALEKLAMQVFKFHTADAIFDPARSGAEWWTQCIDPADDIAMHWDRDYDMQADQGILLHPHLATVTYLTEGGGPTLVLECPSPLMQDESPCRPIHRAEAAFPRVGRHISFDGRMLHGAPSDIAAAAAAPGARRVTFLVNVWLNHVPWGSEAPDNATVKKLRAAERAPVSFPPPAERSKLHASPAPMDAAGCAAQRWSFGDKKARLELLVPWPVPAKGGGAQLPSFVTVDFDAASGAELREAAKPKAKSAGKAKGVASATSKKKRA